MPTEIPVEPIFKKKYYLKGCVISMKHVDLIQVLSAFPLKTETIMTFTLTADNKVVTDNDGWLSVLIPDGKISNRVSDLKDKRQVTMEDGLLFLENLQYSFYGSRLWATKVLD